MPNPLRKSTPEEIRARFDNDVERFSNLETGQTAAVDGALALELIAQCAAATTAHATSLLDIGCGAGNFSLKLLQAIPGLAITLVDLSRPMLDRALERVGSNATAVQGDIRELNLGEAGFDIVVGAAVFHHLREDAEWHAVFAKVHRALRPGGSFWIYDMVSHGVPAVQDAMWRRYGEYLESLKGPQYREHVFAYIEKEDTPRPVLFQVDVLRGAGFREVEVLHKNSCFAAIGAWK
jgi:tRNA (cmo5U34)-methyltransferase